MSEPQELIAQLAHAMGVGTIVINRGGGIEAPTCHIDTVARGQLSLGDGDYSPTHLLQQLSLENSLDELFDATSPLSFTLQKEEENLLITAYSSGEQLLITLQSVTHPHRPALRINGNQQEDGGLLTIFLGADHRILASHWQGVGKMPPYLNTALHGKHIESLFNERMTRRLIVAIEQARSTQSRQTAYFPSPLEGDHRYLKATGRWLGPDGPDLLAVEVENVSFNANLNRDRPSEQGFIIVEEGIPVYSDAVAVSLTKSDPDALKRVAALKPTALGTITLGPFDELVHTLAYSAAFPLANGNQSIIVIRSIDTPRAQRTVGQEDEQFVSLLLDLSFQLLRAPREKADLVINHILERLGIFTGSDRVYIFQFIDDMKVMRNTHEWCNERVTPEKENLQNLPSDVFPQWVRSLTHGQEIYIHDVANLPPSWQMEKDTLQAQDIKTVLVEPIITDTRLHGYIGFDRVRDQRDWGYNERSLLSHFCHLLAAYFERTTQEEELRSALAMAKQLADEKERINVDLNIFYAKISHDIRTILNTIIGTSKLLSESGLNPLQSRYMQVIESNNAFLLNLIRDILDFSLLGHREVIIHELAFSLSETIAQIVQTLQLPADERGMRIIVDLDRAIPCRLLGDSVRITQILLNVIHNAIKYAGGGDIHLKAALSGLDTSSATVTFSVADTGVGMERALIDAVLSSSPSLQKTTRANGGGYGLGLSIVRQLVDAMDGDLAITSEAGKGTTISVSLTFKRPLDDASMIPSHRGCDRQIIVLQEGEAGVWGHLATLRDGVHHANTVQELAQLLETTCSPFSGQVRVLLVEERLVQEPVAWQDLLDLLSADGQPIPLFFIVDHFSPLSHERERRGLGISGYIFKDKELEPQLPEVGCKLAVLPTFESEATVEHYDFRGLRVLAIDDVLINLELLEQRLKALNINVSTASSGQQAISMVRERPFDLIFMDLMMPTMDGIETTSMIRSLPSIEKKMIPVVAITASVSAEDEKRCRLVGIQDFLVKPVAQQELVGILAKYAKVQPTRLQAVGTAVAKSTATIIGMDWQKALSVTNGDEQLLRHLLRRFVSEWDDHPRRYRAAQSSKAEEIRYLHSLLGVLSLLHTQEVQLQCERLLQAVREGRDDDKELLAPVFATMMEAFIVSVREALVAFDLTSIKEPMPVFASAIGEILADLVEPLSKRNLSKVRRLCAALEATPTDDFVRVQVEHLLTLIHGYDYAGALELLEQMGHRNGAVHA